RQNSASTSRGDFLILGPPQVLAGSEPFSSTYLWAKNSNKAPPAVVKAQIGNFVARLSDRIAEATQNNRRNTRYPEIAQLS
ncbi:MAG TPA: hypothetical protein VF783_18655, partial [Terriglobales bacterium]